MAVDSLINAPGVLAGRRSVLVSYLPTASALMFLVALVWAGARGWEKPARGGISFHAAWTTAAKVGTAEFTALLLAIALLSFLLLPLQPLVVRALTSERPHLLRAIQAARRSRLRDRASLDGLPAPAKPERFEPPQHELIRRAGAAGYQLRLRFPLAESAQPLRATGLGNALAAAADGAGRDYGLDAAVVWPRLYGVLDDRIRDMVDAQRDAMDSTARMAATMAVTTAASAVLLCRAGWWCALALIPAALAVLAYVAVVQAALGYGQTVRLAFDLHRLDLLRALAIDVPDDWQAQRAVCMALSDFWRQGVPPPASVVKYTTAKDGK